MDKPFVVCDPRRGNKRASVRSPANRESSVEAFRAASGGSLCVRRTPLPDDFTAIVPRLRRAHNVQYIIVCSNLDDAADPLLVLPVPIEVPSLANCTHEVERIVDEYAADAIAELHARDACFTARDRQWIVEHPTSLAEIEKATLRVVALRMSRNLSDAAERLGMAPVSLWRWDRPEKAADLHPCRLSRPARCDLAPRPDQELGTMGRFAVDQAAGNPGASTIRRTLRRG